MNRKSESDNPFEKIDTLIENQKAVIEELRKKMSEIKDKEKKALVKLETLEHQRIVEIVEYSDISTDMLKQLMLAARSDTAAASVSDNGDEQFDRKEVETDEDDETE